MAKEGNIELLELKDGGNPWLNLIGVLVGIFLVIGAIALWQASFGLALGLGAFGVGGGSYNAFRGVAYIVLAAGDHRARVIRAQGWAQAEQTRALAEKTRAAAELIDARRNGDVAAYRLIGDGERGRE